MSSAESRTCPSCTADLAPVVHEGVELDRCPNGCGLWLDRGELRAVVASEQEDRSEHEERQAVAAAALDAGKSVVAEIAAERRPCPRCGTPMRLTEYATSGIAIDECGSHGVWLDAGELERVEAYAEGIRRQAQEGPAGDAQRARASGLGVAGLDVPADILATIRSATVPIPPPRA